MQDDALDQVAESHVLVLGERLEHLQDTTFQAHAGLDAFDFEAFGRSGHGYLAGPWYQGTMVPTSEARSSPSAVNARRTAVFRRSDAAESNAFNAGFAPLSC